MENLKNTDVFALPLINHRGLLIRPLGFNVHTASWTRHTDESLAEFAGDFSKNEIFAELTHCLVTPANAPPTSASDIHTHSICPTCRALLHLVSSHDQAASRGKPRRLPSEPAVYADTKDGYEYSPHGDNYGDSDYAHRKGEPATQPTHRCCPGHQ